MLPQGLFSVAVATVLFPTLSRMAAGRDAGGDAPRGRHRHAPDQPAADPRGGVHDRARHADRRLVFQRGQFDAQSTHLVSIALFWFAFSLPFGGLNLLLTRTFFAVQRPWIPTRLAAVNIVVDIVVSVGLYKPLGIAGLIIGTVAANAVMTALQLHRLRIGFNGRLEGGQTTMITARILVASALLAVVSWGVWKLLDSLLGSSLVGPDRERRRGRARGRAGLHARGARDARARGPPGEPLIRAQLGRA